MYLELKIEIEIVKLLLAEVMQGIVAPTEVFTNYAASATVVYFDFVLTPALRSPIKQGELFNTLFVICCAYATVLGVTLKHYQLAFLQNSKHFVAKNVFPRCWKLAKLRECRMLKRNKI